MKKSYLFTSESVSEGHPDKVADYISDRLLDLYITHDPEARAGIETLCTTNKVILAGEVRAPEISKDKIESTVRECIREIGYDQDGFSWKTVDVVNLLHEQSADIAIGVDKSDIKQEGAGDQGIMFGYATDETESYMPATLYYAHKLLRKLAQIRHDNIVDFLEPDSKAQITFAYENDVPQHVDTVIVSTQHKESATLDQVKALVEDVIKDVIPAHYLRNETKILVNPTGRFVIGGPDGDTGLTGRKIIVDTYGGVAPHGGGCFSGKDATKVDRSATYMARYLAKNIVASGLAKRCCLQLSYAIGRAEPVSVYVNSYGTGKIEDTLLADWILNNIDLTPEGIRTKLGLNKPIYAATAQYGHFGRTPSINGDFGWEKTDLVDMFKDFFDKDLGNVVSMGSA